MSLDVLKLADQVIHANSEFQAQGTQSGSKLPYALSQIDSEVMSQLGTKLTCLLDGDRELTQYSREPLLDESCDQRYQGWIPDNKRLYLDTRSLCQ